MSRLFSPARAVLLTVTLLFCSALARPAGAQPAPFTRITEGDVINEVFTGTGTQWGDFDGDGHLDLFVGNFNGPNHLYHNNGDGTFSGITTGDLADDFGQTYGCAVGDYDNDGNLDLFVARGYGTGEPNVLYHNKGDGTFARVEDGSIPTDLGHSVGCAWGDYDNDGFLDLFVSNSPLDSDNGDNALYHNGGAAGFTRILTGSLVSDGGDSMGCAWADADNDGDLDLFVANGYSENRAGGVNDFFYYNDGAGAFRRQLTGAIAQDGRHSVGAAWGDYDNDGDLDLFVANDRNEPNSLYQNDGRGSFTKISSGNVVTDGGTSIACAWGDYDNDGFLDLFVGNRAREFSALNFLYHNDTQGGFTRVLTGSVATDIGETSGCAWGDYDNDGFLDLVVSNLDLETFLYHNDGNGNHWLKVRCVGSVSNRAGIGAKVKVKAALGGVATWQLREVSSGDGFSGNNLIACFGLADASIAERVRVEWPSGIVQELPNVAVDQLLTVTEPSERPEPPLEAAFTAEPLSGSAPLTVALDASTSTVPAGATIISYRWDFGDGNEAEGRTASHTYATAGRRAIILTISSSNDLIRRARRMCTVTCPRGDILPWTSVDIGDPAYPGSARLEGAGGEQVLRICAGGEIFSGGSDRCHFVHRELEGDSVLTARIAAASGAPDGWQVGVMVRESLAADARSGAMLFQTGPSGSRFRFFRRIVTGSNLASSSGSHGQVPDVWVRVERQGSMLIGFYSTDGVSWSELQRVAIEGLPERVLWGIVAVGAEPAPEDGFEPLDARVSEIDLGTLPGPFLRGDCNGDGKVDISDAVCSLNWLFLGGEAPGCLAVTNANGDVGVDISDSIWILEFLFLGGPAPAEPFPGCGVGRLEADERLGCKTLSNQCLQ